MPERTALAAGMRVRCRDAEWLVTKVESNNLRGDRTVHCIGADDLVRGHEAIFLEQLDTLEAVDPRLTELEPDKSQGYSLARLFLEAQLRQMPVTGYEADLEGMGVFDSMQFQTDTVNHALRQLRPRLLLADDVGLGKTIQVGMILTELLRRGRAARILVLAKKSMLTQFQSELWNRFAIPLVRLDSEGIAKLRLRIPANKNPFEVYHRVIISIDTLKNVARYEHFLKDTRWDVVVIDEAHNVAGASVPDRHLSYRLARLLARRSDSLLLTTATPHNGKRETFGRLISLLDPAAIPDPQLRDYTGDDVRGFFLQRFKEDVRGQAGGLLSDRRVVERQHTTLKASPKEEAVYAILAELRAQIIAGNQNSKKGWSSHTLVSYGLYKSFLSSPEACLSTVEKRLKAIEKEADAPPETVPLKQLHAALSTFTLAETSRYQILKRQLFELGWTGKAGSPRVVLFTESRRTQDALFEVLSREFKLKTSARPEDQANQAIASIHGGTPDTCLTRTVEAFATGSSPVRLLIATDVASEGINLHHECHDIIHYDLPWSIITLVQRNGRIDRLGQKHSSVIRYLMVSTDQGLLSGDDAIFERLITKVEEINRLRKSGESVLQLYDEQAEEEYIAQKGILDGKLDLLEESAVGADPEANAMQAVLDEANLTSSDDFLAYLLGEEAVVPDAASKMARTLDLPTSERVRLFSDQDYLLDGYKFLASQSEDYKKIEKHDKIFILKAPNDLKRRLGAPDDRGDVVFGSTAIPEEAWPENGEFRLTSDLNQAKMAIDGAREMSGYWSKDLYCMEQNPLLQWITERLLMQLPRSAAPYILAPRLPAGDLCFCFIGLVSSQAGKPLVSDSHTITFSKTHADREATPKEGALRETLEHIGLQTIANTGQEPKEIDAAKKLVPAAVECSLQRMKRLWKSHEEKMMPLLRKEERRLQRWSSRRAEVLEEKLDGLSENSPHRGKWQRALEEIDDFQRDRQVEWRDTYFKAASEPITQLVLVIAGTGAADDRKAH